MSADIQPSNQELPKELQMDLERLELQFIRTEVLGGLATMQVVAEQDSDLKHEIFRYQAEDPFIAEEIWRISQGKKSVFRLGDYESLWFQDRLCVPYVTEICDVILREAHETPYSIHPGSTKMYMDLKELFLWNNMKRDIAKYVSECHTCQRVMAEHQSPAGPLQPLEIPEWKWEEIGMDFITGFPMTPKRKDMIWVIVDRLTKNANFISVNQKDNAEKLVEVYVKR